MARKVTALQIYLSQRGLLSRVAKKLKVDPSYVSRVARGKRKNEKIMQAIQAELKSSK